MSAKYHVVVTDPAEADILDIAGYIATDDENAALRWLDDVQAKVDTLNNFPYRAPIIPEAPELGPYLRHLLHGSYRAIFRIDGDRVIILRVVHGSRLLDASFFRARSKITCPDGGQISSRFGRPDRGKPQA